LDGRNLVLFDKGFGLDQIRQPRDNDVSWKVGFHGDISRGGGARGRVCEAKTSVWDGEEWTPSPQGVQDAIKDNDGTKDETRGWVHVKLEQSESTSDLS